MAAPRFAWTATRCCLRRAIRAAVRERRIGVMAINTALFMEHVVQEPDAFATVGPSWSAERSSTGPRRRAVPEARPRRLVNVYGPTECTVYATAYEIPDTVERGERIPIGRPIGSTGARVADAEGRPVPPCIPGELCLFGPGLAKGYLDRPDLTREKFVLRKMGGLGTQRVYRTGDQGLLDRRGRPQVIGRADQREDTRLPGRTREIESVIERVAEVDSCVVDIRQDDEVVPGSRPIRPAPRGPDRPPIPRNSISVNGRDVYRLAYGDPEAASPAATTSAAEEQL